MVEKAKDIMMLLKKYWGVILVLALSYWAIQPFFIPGFFPMHDDTQVVRVGQMAQALSDGHFPVRWVKDLGYGFGYPLFNFYAPLAYYVGGFLNMVGMNALDATKAMMVIGILLSGIFMYLLARKFWGEIGGIVSGLFYVYAPYHAVDIYVRGAVGELWAYAFLPLLALGLYKRSVFVGAIGFAGIILSHNLTALMLVPFLLIILLIHCIIAYRKKNSFFIHRSSFIILLGLGLSAFYWLPALAELSNANVTSQIGGGADFRNHFVCLQQLWQSPWGFGGSTLGCLDGLSLKIGKLHIITALLAFLVGLYVRKKDKEKSVVVLLASGFLLLAIFLMLEISKPVWEVFWNPMAIIQYPWRFLVFASFFSSFLAGAIIWFLRNQLTLLVAGVGIVSLLFLNSNEFEPRTISPKTSSDYLNEYNIKWTTSKISDEYMPRDFAKPVRDTDTVKNRVQDGQISVDKTQELVFTVNQRKSNEIVVSIAPFPAWQASIDGVTTAIVPRNNGMLLSVPAGSHQVKLAFISTPIEKTANTISVISILILIFGIVVRYGKKGT